MSIAIRGRKLSLAWLKPPPVPPDGNMSLYDHLRELRYRLVFAVVSIIVGMAFCAIFYTQLFSVMMWPLDQAIAELERNRPGMQIEAVTNQVAEPFLVAMKVIGIAGLVLTTPVWVYQLWAFIRPGLLANEKKWARIFVGSATPLFLAGVVSGYIVMPKGIEVLLGFTIDNKNITNQIPLNDLMGLLVRVMLVFGISYLIPLVMLILNFIGILKAQHLTKFRPFIVFGAFVFSAVATPSTDPISMVALALPLTILMLVVEFIARINDKRRAAKGDDPIANDKVLAELNAQDEKDRAEREAKELGSAPTQESVADALGVSGTDKS